MADFGVPCRMVDGEDVVVAVVADDAAAALRVALASAGPGHRVRDAFGRRIPGHIQAVTGEPEPLDRPGGGG